MSERPRNLLTRLTELPLTTLFRLCGGWRVYGQENLPKSGAAILAPNHRSWCDPPAIGLAVPRACWFMANDFLFRIPVLGKLIPYYGAFPVRRGGVDRETLRTAESHLKNGDFLCIFPEGGTTVTGKLFYPLEGGVALIAMRSNVPIIPVAMTGTDGVVNPKFPFLHHHKGGITVTFGKPLYPDQLFQEAPRKERIDLLTELLWDKIAELLPPEYVPAEKPKRSGAESAR